MELFLVSKGSKFIVQDKKERLLYTIKKKSFGKKFLLLDASGYELYSFVQIEQSKKPQYEIVLNEKLFIIARCISLFLDPSIEFEFQTGKLQGVKATLKSSDRKHFTLFKEEVRIGTINVITGSDGELQYEIEIENDYFDDYVPLFALSVDRAFGDMNKSK